MAFTPTLTSTTSNNFAPPAPMRDFKWVKDPVTGYYDIQNEFTPPTNDGNLQVIQSKILITLNTAQGEWRPDLVFGLNETAITDNADNPDVIGQIISSEILSVQNVNNVVILTLDYTATTRNLSSSFSANTAFGVTTITVG